MKKVKMSIWLWRAMIRTLRQKGEGRRESGAFLFARKGSRKISSFQPYDLFDPHCMDTGIITFSAEGQIRLSEYCIKNKLQVVGDVHTHPGDSTLQSTPDKEHPMVNVPGHIALIVPDYAQRSWQFLQGVGRYYYQGSFKWRDFDGFKLSWL